MRSIPGGPQRDLGALRRELSDEVDEAQVQRMWDRVRTQRAARRAGAEARARRSPRWILLAAAAAAALVGLGVFLGTSSPPDALRTADGDLLPAAIAGGETVALSDGSTVAISEDGQLDVLESSGSRLRLALRRGAARFEVTPGGPRTWQVLAGPCYVEVVGTVFEVDRRVEETRVFVERGAVLVHGAAVPDQAQRLEAGESLVIPNPDATPRARSEGAPHVPEEPAPALDLEDPPAPRAENVTAEDPPQQGARVRADRDPVGEALSAADRLRREGRYRLAAARLERIANEYPHDMRARLARLSLARLQLDHFQAPRDAAAQLERCIRDGLPAALDEPARGALLEALCRSGSDRAEHAADELRRRYPSSEYLVRFAECVAEEETEW